MPKGRQRKEVIFAGEEDKEIESRLRSLLLLYFYLTIVVLFGAVELKKRQEKAQEKGDTVEESKICNAIGERYFQNGTLALWCSVS